MSKQIDVKSYQDFVEEMSSPQSVDMTHLIDSLDKLNETGKVNVPRLLTAAIGMCGEVGEFDDIVKKIVFQGKVLDDKVKEHLVKELGDIFWYVYQACSALQIDALTVMQMNHDKLRARYEDGFSVESSEVRQQGDI